MSLLRAVPRSLPKANLIARALTTQAHDAPVVSREKASSTEITPQQPKEVLAADIVSGAPAELRHRQVRIYVPTRNTMQSGGAKGERWRIDFDILQGGGRWENQLMGWASSADYNQALRIGFRTKEDAIHFAEKQGWDYYIQPETVKRVPPKNYSESFVFKSKPLRILRTK